MINLNRDITVLLKYGFMTERNIRQQVEMLNKLLIQTESPESFCTAHELVDRNRITSNTKKILKESRFYNLKPFRFLINKN
jgi:hypothetical protein